MQRRGLPRAPPPPARHEPYSWPQAPCRPTVAIDLLYSRRAPPNSHTLTMSLTRITTVAAATLVTAPVFAAAPDATSDWFTPKLDIRTRYEYRETDGADASHAVTTRARVGLLTQSFNGFSAFGELEATYALVDDYTTGAAGTSPMAPGATAISDPENVELNRAWVQYSDGGPFTAKFGRQRIIRNNAAFIGNVGWRQNEQTYDALSLHYEANGFALDYAYAFRTQRIFGDDAAKFLKEMEGDFHFFDVSTEINGGKAGGYAYLIDVDPVGVAPSTNVGESNTFGAWIKSGGLHAELAWQDGESTLVPGSGDYDALYGHVKYDLKSGGATYGIGVEYLEENFKTPFATVHAYNGFADAFIAQRLGLNNLGGSYDGLADVYLSYVRPGLPGGITFKGFLHYFMDDGFSDTYGWEADAVFVKKINDNLTAILKLAAFFEEDGPGGYGDIQQASLGLNYSF